MMNIYGVIYSPYAARVVIAARFKGVKYKMSAPKDGLKTPAFLKLNPLGKVPVLKDGSTVLFESAVIVEYLEAKYKKKPLVPKAAKAGAEARLIAAMFSEYLQPNTLALWSQLDPSKRDQAVVDAKVAEVSRILDIIEKRMGSKYCAGSKLTIADVYAVPVMFFVLTLLPMIGVADPLKGRKKLAKYAVHARKDKILGGVLADMDAAFKQVMGI
jgi:glutathione S-transferase